MADPSVYFFRMLISQPNRSKRGRPTLLNTEGVNESDPLKFSKITFGPIVRPDGYIALASFEQSASKLRTFVEQFQLRFQNPALSAQR